MELSVFNKPLEIRTSQEPAGVPGCYFHLRTVAGMEPYSDGQFFTAYIDNKPVGQLALVKREQLWWTDYLYVQEEFRGQGIGRALRKEALFAAAQITDCILAQCVGVTAEDLDRSGKRLGIQMDVLYTFSVNNRPVTVIRRHLASLRKT